jgi:hypothetical protein
MLKQATASPIRKDLKNFIVWFKKIEKPRDLRKSFKFTKVFWRAAGLFAFSRSASSAGCRLLSLPDFRSYWNYR